MPTTSTRLPRDIAADRDSLRWNEFVHRYRPMPEAFVQRRFPSLAGEADDLIQETLLAFMEALPGYRYDAEELGSFHNYLTGILRNRVCRELRSRDRGERAKAAAEPDEWRDVVCDIALRQVLSSPRRERPRRRDPRS